MKTFDASLVAIYYRLNLMVGIIVGSFAIGIPFLGLLAVPLFASCLLGISFTSQKKIEKNIIPFVDKRSSIEKEAA